jgi:hypothetical protein
VWSFQALLLAAIELPFSRLSRLSSSHSAVVKRPLSRQSRSRSEGLSRSALRNRFREFAGQPRRRKALRVGDKPRSAGSARSWIACTDDRQEFRASERK